jgi:hypothetical protein
MLPVDEVKIESLRMSEIGFGKCIYTKKQMDEFAAFQDSQEMRTAYQAETDGLAYIGRNGHGEWALDLGSQAQASMINIIGMRFIPIYEIVSPSS